MGNFVFLDYVAHLKGRYLHVFECYRRGDTTHLGGDGVAL